MRTSAKKLVKRLTPTATRALSAAVGRAASGQFYEVTPEHLLLALLEPRDGDASLLCESAGVDRLKLVAQVERALGSMRSGNPGRPVFGPGLLRWLSDAWLLASVEYGEAVLRSGLLLVTWARQDGVYSASALPELEELGSSAVQEGLESVLARSPEQAESREHGESTGPGLGAASGQGEALSRYTLSFTEKAKNGKIDPVLGRHAEIREVIHILARRRKNNPIIVGEPGVGKTALVEGLALAIVEGAVPEELCDVDVRGLDLAALQAGAGLRGEFENRLKAVINEIKASATPIVLFIDEAHTLIGAGGSQGTGDAANLLKPELARGELRTIAATTWAEYKKYFEKDAALERRFQPVKVDEPSEEGAIAILRGLRELYEQAHGVEIVDEAVVAAVRLSSRYVAGRQLPDKAVDLLDSAATLVKLARQTKPDALMSLESRVQDLACARRALSRDRESGREVDLEELARLERELEGLSVERDALQTCWEAERSALGPTPSAQGGELSPVPVPPRRERAGAMLIPERVDAASVAKVVERWTGIPVGKLRQDSVQELLTLEEQLARRVRGQDEAVRTVAETVRSAKAGIQPPEAPQGVLLFVGPSGVGKTETALALADLLYGGERFLTSINMSEFQEKHSLSRLVGSPPGYVGYGEGGVLTEAVRQRPYSVVLLDEVEKADLEVMNLFYQVFDKGTLSDGEGRSVDFKNTIVILTSNLASAEITRMHEGGRSPSAEEVAEAIQPILSRHFKPALLARMTVVPYRPMGEGVLREVARLKLQELTDRIARTHKLRVHTTPKVFEALAQRCHESEAGARKLDHILRGSLMPQLSRELLAKLADDRAPSELSIDLTQGEWAISLR